MSGNIPFTEYAVAILWDIPLQNLINVAGIFLVLVLIVLGYCTWQFNLAKERDYQAWLQKKGLKDSRGDFYAEFLAENP